MKHDRKSSSNCDYAMQLGSLSFWCIEIFCGSHRLDWIAMKDEIGINTKNSYVTDMLVLCTKNWFLSSLSLLICVSDAVHISIKTLRIGLKLFTANDYKIGRFIGLWRGKIGVVYWPLHLVYQVK
jgi:hypothetical protein